MPDLALPLITRKFLPADLVIDSWLSVKKYFSNLLDRGLDTAAETEKWLADRSELMAAIEEEKAWRYIRMSCNTEDRELAAAYGKFVVEINPETERLFNLLDQKLAVPGILEKIPPKRYFVFLRALKRRMEIFRQENLPLLADLQVMEQEYGRITGSLSIHFNGSELTLQQASNHLRENDRQVREKVYCLILQTRISQTEKLNRLFDKLVGKRMQVASVAGFKTFREYKFAELGRFDYTVDDCLQLHESVKTHVIPLVEEIHRRRVRELGLEMLKPWDLEVDPEGKPDIRPFGNADELIDKISACFNEIRQGYGDYLRLMFANGFMDLESRKAKAPGGFNYPLYESNVPFIFMNSVGSLRDLETMAHEGGHALHSFLSSSLPLIDFKMLPAEVAELASMAMELISMEHWHHFFPDRETLLRARRNQLEHVISILPWIVAIDRFQHWVYTHPGHTRRERDQAWVSISREYMSSVVDHAGVEEGFCFAWQKQLHVFEMPFYYIEYAIAQLGAIAVWKNYRNDPADTLGKFERALRLGYSEPIPDIYRVAGIQFSFSGEYIRELTDFVWEELSSIVRAGETGR